MCVKGVEGEWGRGCGVVVGGEPGQAMCPLQNEYFRSSGYDFKAHVGHRSALLLLCWPSIYASCCCYYFFIFHLCKRHIIQGRIECRIQASVEMSCWAVPLPPPPPRLVVRFSGCDESSLAAAAAAASLAAATDKAASAKDASLEFW